MEIKINPYLLILSVALILIGPIGVFAFFNKKTSNDDILESLLLKYGELNDSFEGIQNKNQSLEKVISSISKDNKKLLSQIAQIKSQKDQVKVITVTEYQTKEIVKVYEKLPLEHIYKNDFDLPLCMFSSKDNKLEFKTLPIEYRTTIVNGSKTSNVSITAKSSFDGKTYEIPLKKENINITTIKEKREIIKPNISVGISSSFNQNEMAFSPTVMVPFIHPRDDLDVLSPKISINEKLSVGINFADYNIAKHTNGIITDTWLGIGVSTAFDSHYIDLTVTSKF